MYIHNQTRVIHRLSSTTHCRLSDENRLFNFSVIIIARIQLTYHKHTRVHESLSMYSSMSRNLSTKTYTNNNIIMKPNLKDNNI